MLILFLVEVVDLTVEMVVRMLENHVTMLMYPRIDGELVDVMDHVNH